MSLRLMRGQVVIRETTEAARSSIFWTPEQKQREIRTHRGVVLGLGPPAQLSDGTPVPHGFEVGDTVQYHFTFHREAATRVWPKDGLPATWVPQENVDAVIEP